MFRTVFLCFLLTARAGNLFAQHTSFHLDYVFGGIGSNQFQTFYPYVNLNGETLDYTIEKRNGKYSIDEPFKDTLWTMDTLTLKTKMSAASVDSIIALIGIFKDTTIFESNDCIMSGGVYFLNIAMGTDTVKYELMNTFDTTALKIAGIVNHYLPVDNKIPATGQLIKGTANCDEYLRKKWAEDDKKKKKK